MRARGAFNKWVTRSGLAVLLVTLVSFVAAPGAQAAVPNGSITPFLTCYWDNGDGTMSGVIGVTSTNAGTVTVNVGTQNRVTLGNPDRGQPETFAHGTTNNAWVFQVTYADVQAGINWDLTGNNVAVNAVNQCASKPPLAADGNGLAFLAFGALTTLAGGIFLNGRRRAKVRLSDIA
jgi:hypothetical protein